MTLKTKVRIGYSLIAIVIGLLLAQFTHADYEEKLQKKTEKIDLLLDEREGLELDYLNYKLKNPLYTDCHTQQCFEDLERMQNKRLQLTKKRNEIQGNEEADSNSKGIEAFLKTHCSPELHDKASSIREIGTRNSINPESIVAIAWADSRCGKQITTAFNYGNVGNTDGGRRQAFSSVESGLEAIAQTLNNKYLNSKQGIGSLSIGGGGVGHVYATSKYNWNYNVKWALSQMLGEDIDESFNFRI